MNVAEQWVLLIVYCCFVSIGFVVTFLKLQKLKKENKTILANYGELVDVDSYLSKQKKKAIDLEKQYQDAKVVYDEHQKLLAIYKDELDFHDFGIYQPQYSFESSQEYKDALDGNLKRQKALVKSEQAVYLPQNWNVDGSLAKGRQMVKRTEKLMLRSFNGDCNSAIAKVKWNNETRMEERIRRSFFAVNKLGKTSKLYIKDEFLSLKIEDLRLTYEYEKKKYDEKEEQRLIRQQMREEEKAQQELDRAQKEAEKEESQYARALEKARDELVKADQGERASLEAKISGLQTELQTALEKKERAISRAQQTRSGHVYVVSNIGSFGEGVFKIGMTRRLEPHDRVKELGDASVPFNFDCHAMIYSDDAPALESKIHRAFDSKRLNLVNFRKEFFKVKLEEIEKVVKDNLGNFKITKLAEAADYRQSSELAKKRFHDNTISSEIENGMPDSLFGQIINQ